MDGQSTKDASQTLLRGLDIVEAVADAPLALDALVGRLGLSRSTTHRLATALVQRGFLAAVPRVGYRLGPRLLALGHAARDQIDLVQIARPAIAALAAETGDTVHIGVLDGDQALYLDKVPGSRRVAISSRIGDRQPLTTTGLGKALMLGHGKDYWRARHVAEAPRTGEPDFLARMADYAALDRAFDLEENEDRIRCVAAPIRDGSGRIMAAISVSSAAHYMDDTRMIALSELVRQTAAGIAADLGYRGAPNDASREGRDIARRRTADDPGA